jgi:Flp pilus assembly protein TadG
MNLKGQKGQALILGALLVPILLALGGISVDVAHAFLKKSQLQRAVDGAAMAGIARYDSGVTDAAEVEAATEQMARYNLLQMSVKEADIQNIDATLMVDANQVAEITLNCQIRVPTFFMHMIPGDAFENISLGTGSTSKRNPAVVSLVLDTSGSMADEIDELRAAAHAFIDSFEEGLDQMSIVTFSFTATVRQPMAIINKANLHAIIDTLVADGWTNIPEAVATGRQQIEAANNPEAVEAVLLFTDGAPNNLRGIFTNGIEPPLILNYPGNPTWNDYVLYVGNIPVQVRRPGTLTLDCDGEPAGADDDNDSGTIADQDDIEDCFSTLAFKDSREVTRPGTDLINREDSRAPLLRESYKLAVVESDYGKIDGTTFYTIGLGTPATEGADVYQSITNYSNIKSYLLKRIANDPAGEGDPDFPGLPWNANYPAGLYFQTPDPADLVELFQAVAKRIRLRLIK